MRGRYLAYSNLCPEQMRERILAAAALRSLDPGFVAEVSNWASLVTPELMRHVLGGYSLPLEGIHGLSHWLRVLENGRILAARTPGADPVLVELFALLHDSRRRHDGADRGHGERAARFAQDLRAEGLLDLDAGRFEVLAEACARHDRGEISSDPTIGCCWDADRLELARLGRRPIARLLSTAAALDPVVQADAWQIGSDEKAAPDLARAWFLGVDDSPRSIRNVRQTVEKHTQQEART